MIQRIQTVYLAVSVLMLGGLFLLDDLWETAPAQQWPWFVPALLGTGALAAVIALVSVFLYGNRKRQKSVVGLAQIVVLIALLGLAAANLITGDYRDVQAWIPAIPLAAALLLLVLAKRGIQHDINLIRSMDRLR